VAKIGAGKIDLAFSQIRVEDVCDTSMRMVRQAAQKKGVTVRSAIDPAVQVIEADVRRLKQILMNLLSNAIKFTPDGGEIGLEVKGDPEHGVVHFSVWDTGIGIAAEEMSRLFQPFVQIDSRLSRQYEGTGLGLVLVARLAELHGGSVAVESTPGAGSRFSVTLPWQPGAAARATAGPETLLDDVPQEPVATVRATSQTILLVDDTDVSARATADYLTAAGHRVIVAHSGEEALALASAVHLTMILTDIQMPSMDGLEVIQHLRRMPAHAATPIIALTALAMPGDRERCIAAGADEYLSKPIHLRNLRELIDRLHSRA
jgi:CheY-like chemotaxis protein/anti-sigma regulatory factor (Ser/Thr protein kinase)